MELPARAGTPGHKPGAAASDSESQAAAFKLCVVAARAGGPTGSWGLEAARSKLGSVAVAWGKHPRRTQPDQQKQLEATAAWLKFQPSSTSGVTAVQP